MRSSRHYYLDYALENDAVYVHWGWSPQAQSDISSLGINNINGLTYEGVYFFRDKSVNAAYDSSAALIAASDSMVTVPIASISLSVAAAVSASFLPN